MSCNYAENLSPYENKGICGAKEIFDEEEDVNRKVEVLTDLILNAKCVCVHTGAGISTASGIPDFRGKEGVWTLEKKGIKPTINISFNEAIPTKTHMALKLLLDKGYIHYIVSQNIDGLHLRSGIPRKNISELHGNMFIEECEKCRKQFVRSDPVPTVGKKFVGHTCRNAYRPCRGQLLDNILDWEHELPEDDLHLASLWSSIADLNLCLGTTLQINPSGTLPLRNKRYGGKIVICNLQPTLYDKKADLLIHTYVDSIFEKLMKRLGMESIPDYQTEHDPTKNFSLLEWTIPHHSIKDIEVLQKERFRAHKHHLDDKDETDVYKKVKKTKAKCCDDKKDTNKLDKDKEEDKDKDKDDI